MLDTSDTYKLVDYPLATGRTTIEFRWPTDQEWARRVYGQRLLVRSLGRGRQTFESLPDSNLDLEIFHAILAHNGNGAPPVTPAEATMILDQAAECDVQEVEMEGNRLKIKLRVMGGMITHMIDLPTADQVLRYKRKQAKTIQLPHNLTESRRNLQAAGEMWAECHGAVEGHIGPPSLIHKEAAWRQAMEFLEQLAAPMDDAPDF